MVHTNTPGHMAPDIHCSTPLEHGSCAYAQPRSRKSISVPLLTWSPCTMVSYAKMPIPAPRLCHLSKRSGSDGFGFHISSQRNQLGQIISVVEPESSAEAAGLLVGDRIVEVNGVNIGLENHRQVVTRIKAGGDTTILLVVDKKCDEYHKEHEIVIKSNLPHIVKLYDKTEEDKVKKESTIAKLSRLKVDFNMNDIIETDSNFNVGCSLKQTICKYIKH